MTKVVLVGASGFGGEYIKLFREETVPDARVCAVADPYASSSPHFAWLCEKGIPAFPRLEDFYGDGRWADLVVISSPIQFHRRQAETAMQNGAAVLCEKPLCAGAADAAALLRIWEKTGVPFGVGFQWSFSSSMEALKRDILDGTLGKPLLLKTIVSWPKEDAYYGAGGWKGKRRDQTGLAVNDSVAMNAASHYLHNMLFVLGDKPDASICPETLSGSLYRVRSIETFDTCFLRGRFADGCTFLFCASHAAERVVNPRFEYRFEKGTVYYDENVSGTVRAEFQDGSVKEYGSPQSDGLVRRKLMAMTDAAHTGKQPVCGIRTVIPHLLVCDAILEGLDITPFPKELIVRETDRLLVSGLTDAMEAFYQTEKMPDTAAVPWITPERTVRIHAKERAV